MDEHGERKEELAKGLMSSKKTTSIKMIAMIEKMQKKGLWVMYKQNEKKERRPSNAT